MNTLRDVPADREYTGGHGVHRSTEYALLNMTYVVQYGSLKHLNLHRRNELESRG